MFSLSSSPLFYFLIDLTNSPPLVFARFPHSFLIPFTFSCSLCSLCYKLAPPFPPAAAVCPLPCAKAFSDNRGVLPVSLALVSLLPLPRWLASSPHFPPPALCFSTLLDSPHISRSCCRWLPHFLSYQNCLSLFFVSKLLRQLLLLLRLAFDLCRLSSHSARLGLAFSTPPYLGTCTPDLRWLPISPFNSPVSPPPLDTLSPHLKTRCLCFPTLVAPNVSELPFATRSQSFPTGPDSTCVHKHPNRLL
jgi:hypothetical protein